MPLFSVLNTSQRTVAELCQAMGTFLPGFTMQPLHPDPDWTCQVQLAIEPDVALMVGRFDRDWSLHYPAGDCLGLYIPIENGRLQTGSQVTARVGQALLVAGRPAQPVEWRTTSELHGAAMIFSEAVVRRVLDSAHEGADLEALDLAPVLDLTCEPGRHFQLVGRAIAAGMLGSRLRQHSPLTFDLMLEAAVCLLLAQAQCKPDNSLEVVERAVPQQVRRAIDFMQANMHDPITVADIAAAAGVSVRSLQWGFSQYCSSSPSAYLRQIRLEAVHRELIHPENTLSVGEVAIKWGFSHLGRFAAQYRAVYGRTPSRTQRGP